MFDTYTLNTEPHREKFFPDSYMYFIREYLQKHNLTFEEIRSRHKSGLKVKSKGGVNYSEIRKALIYSLLTDYGLTYRRVCKIFDLHLTSVWHAHKTAYAHIKAGDEKFMRLMEMA